MTHFMFEFQCPGTIFTFIRSFEAADYDEAQRLAERHAKIQGWTLLRSCGKM